MLTRRHDNARDETTSNKQQSKYKLEFLLQLFESRQQSWQNDVNASQVNTQQIRWVNDHTCQHCRNALAILPAKTQMTIYEKMYGSLRNDTTLQLQISTQCSKTVWARQAELRVYVFNI